MSKDRQEGLVTGCTPKKFSSVAGRRAPASGGFQPTSSGYLCAQRVTPACVTPPLGSLRALHGNANKLFFMMLMRGGGVCSADGEPQGGPCTAGCWICLCDHGGGPGHFWCRRTGAWHTPVTHDLPTTSYAQQWTKVRMDSVWVRGPGAWCRVGATRRAGTWSSLVADGCNPTGGPELPCPHPEDPHDPGLAAPVLAQHLGNLSFVQWYLLQGARVPRADPQPPGRTPSLQ